MAATDDWVPVSPAPSGDDWAPVSGAAPKGGDFQQPGEQQARSDEAIVAKERGMVPDAVKAATYAGTNTAFVGIPTHVMALQRSYEEGIPYKEAVAKQREYEAALERANPTASKIGTGLGFGASLVTPLGPLGTAGTKAAQLAGRLGAGTVGKSIASGATIGGEFGALSGLTEKYGTDEFTPKGIAESAGLGAVGGGTLGPVAERVVGKFLKTAEPFVDPATGKLTQSALETAKSAFGNRLSDADIAAMEPQLKSAYEAAQGVSPEAAKEALALTVGGDKSRAMTTGIKPSEAAAPFAQAAREKTEQAILSGAEGVAPPPTAQFSAAESFHATERARHQPISAAYDAAEAVPVEFGKDFITNNINNNINDALRQNKLRTNFRGADNFPSAQNAQAAIRDRLLGGDLPYNEGLTSRNLIAVRQELNDIYKGAETGSQDARAVKAIIKGFDNTIDKATSANEFTGDAVGFLQKQAAANKLNNKYMSDFYPDAGPEAAAFRNFMRQFSGDKSSSVPNQLIPENAQAAQNKLTQYAMNPNFGPAFYNRVENALGSGSLPMSEINNSLISGIVNVDLNRLSPSVKPSQQLAKQINDALKPDTLPVVMRAFGANAADPASVQAAQQQISKLRQYSEAARMINAQQIPEVDKQNQLWVAAKKFGLPLVGAAFGAPHGIIGSSLGLLGGEAGSAIGRGIGRASDVAAEKAGAPRAAQQFTGEGFKTRLHPYAIQPGVRDWSQLAPPDTEPNYGIPQQRASGGRVMTAKDLISAMEDASKKDVKETKPLLKSSDTAVAHALEIANQHI